MNELRMSFGDVIAASDEISELRDEAERLFRDEIDRYSPSAFLDKHIKTAASLRYDRRRQALTFWAVSIAYDSLPPGARREHLVWLYRGNASSALGHDLDSQGRWKEAGRAFRAAIQYYLLARDADPRGPDRALPSLQLVSAKCLSMVAKVAGSAGLTFSQAFERIVSAQTALSGSEITLPVETMYEAMLDAAAVVEQRAIHTPGNLDDWQTSFSQWLQQVDAAAPYLSSRWGASIARLTELIEGTTADESTLLDAALDDASSRATPAVVQLLKSALDAARSAGYGAKVELVRELEQRSTDGEKDWRVHAKSLASCPEYLELRIMGGALALYYHSRRVPALGDFTWQSRATFLLRSGLINLARILVDAEHIEVFGQQVGAELSRDLAVAGYSLTAEAHPEDKFVPYASAVVGEVLGATMAIEMHSQSVADAMTLFERDCRSLGMADYLRDRAVAVAATRFASDVVERCIATGDDAGRVAWLKEIQAIGLLERLNPAALRDDLRERHLRLNHRVRELAGLSLQSIDALLD